MEPAALDEPGVMTTNGTLLVRLISADPSNPDQATLRTEYTAVLEENAVSEVVLLTDQPGPEGLTDGAELEFIQLAADAGITDIRLVFDDYDRVMAELNGTGGSAEAELTAKQEAVVRRAFDLGYFDVPRQADLGDLTDEFGISKQALSERLRRGVNQLAADLESRADD